VEFNVAHHDEYERNRISTLIIMPVPFNKAIYLSVAQKAASTQKCCCAIPTSKPTCIDISRSANAAAAVELANLFHTITGYQVESTFISDGGQDLYDKTANKWTVEGKLLKYTDDGEFGEVSGQLYSMDIVAGGLSVVLFDDYAFDTLQYGPRNNMGADGAGEKLIHEFDFLNWRVHIEVILDPTTAQVVITDDINDSPNHVVMILVDRSEGVVIKPTSTSTEYQDIKLSGISNSRIIFLHGAINDPDNETFKASSPIFQNIATQIIGLH